MRSSTLNPPPKLTSNDDVHGTGRRACPDRRVRSARVATIVTRRDRLDEQRSAIVHVEPRRLGHVDDSLVFRPNDERHGRIGVDGTVDPSEQTSR